MYRPQGYGTNGFFAGSLPLIDSPPPQSQVPQSQLPLGLSPTGDFAFAVERVRRDALDKWDALTSRQEIRLHQGRLWFPEAAQSDFGTGFLTPTSWAASQFCQRLGIPAHYFRKCPASLQDGQFNYWIQREHIDADAAFRMTGAEAAASETPSVEDPSERWLLRAKGDALRGVLSERYAPLDNDHLLECLAAVLPKGFTVDWFSLTDESLHLRLVDPRSARSVLPDDDLMVGLHVGNSEVGKRAVTVDALVYRLVCTNGLIRLVKGRSLLYRRHVSWSSERFREALQTAVTGALAASTEFLGQLQEATRTPVPDVPAVLKVLGDQHALSQRFLETVERSLKSEPASQQETVWGLVNGLTQAAQGLPPDDRYGIEALAGRLIDSGLPKIPARIVAPISLRREALASPAPQAATPLRNGSLPRDDHDRNGSEGNGYDQNAYDQNGDEEETKDDDATFREADFNASEFNSPELNGPAFSGGDLRGAGFDHTERSGGASRHEPSSAGPVLGRA